MAARNPLSPLKPLAEQAPWAANGPVKPAMPLEPPSPAFSDFFSSPVVGQAPATVHPAKGAAGRHASRIPRPTPSPDGPAPTSSGLKHRADIPSRIPRLSLPVAHTSDTGNGDLPDGFLSYINPSFGEEADAPAPLAPAAAPAGPLATPDAMQILQRVAHPWDKKPEPMQGIANAMLRTGPQKLSPEPSRDYCIAAPKPPAMANPAAAAAAARLGSATVEPSLVLRDGSGAVEDTHSGACSIDGPPRPPETCEAAETDTPTAQIARKDSNPLVPSTVCSMAPAPAAPPAQAGERAEPAPSHHAAAPTVLLPAVNSAGHEERAAASPSAGHWAEASPHLLEDPASVLAHGAAPQTLMAMPSPEELQAGAPPSRVVSPVAFNLMSESPGSDPASVDRQQRQEEQEESPGAASIGKPGSSGSFSFGMGAKGDPTPEVIAPPPPAAAGQGAADKRPPPLERPGSGESVDQPNPFASMLVHLMDGGKGALMSPSHRAVLQCAVRAVDSPQSPEHLTPLGLLSSHEGAATATPELGKGDLQAWIDRRGMRAVLNSPAVADLRRMWGAMREGASARAAAEAAASEAEALRRELASARDALAQLSEEHEAALAAAADGKEWAEAEVARAREAAAHMMALADQIQATFAMCEAEKCNLAEELESALARAEEAERLARGVAGKAAASEEQRAAAEALKAELAAAQQAAEAARAEARAAQAAAAASTEDLTAIRLQLQQAEEALAAAGEQGSTGSAAPEAAATPMTKLRMQLHSVHEALASLHATSGRAVQGPASPQVGRMVAASRMGLSHAGHLLEADAQQLQAANEELRGLVAEVHAKVQQLSPAGTPDLKRALVPSCDAGGAPGEEQRQLAFESETSSPEGGHQEAGSVTVDFQELREVLLLQAHVASGAAAPAPSPSPMQGPTCDLDVDGVVVTNIPESHVSQVRAMVSYFEALAVGGSSSDQESAEDQEEREEEMKSEARDYESVGDADGHAAVLGEESSYEEADESELAEVEAEVMGAPYAAPSLGHGTWVPAPSPAISERMAAALPAGLPATPLMPLAHGAMAPAAHAPPSTPACTPADGFTPGDQRRHLETLDALAALRDAHAGYAANPSSPTSPTDAVTAVAAEVTTPLGESAAWYVEQGGGSAVSPPAPYSITPVDMDAVRRGTGSALRGEVRARLQRLKAELQAARTKLHQVDCGLAAIATPGSASVSRQSSLRAASPTADAGVQESSRAEPAAPVPQEHVTPAGIAAPTPKTRPSVRFADSVKSGSPEHRALRPGTPATVSTVEAEGELEPRPELGSAREVAQPVAAVPGPAMALFPESTWAEAAAAPNERAGAAPAPAATPLRRLTLDSDSDSDGEGVGTTGSSRVAVRLGTPLGAGIAPRGTPVTHAESRFAGALAGLGTPSMSRFSSASSSSMTPEPAALLAMRPVVGRVRRGPGAGGRRVSLSEEKEFRRRAAALKIHVSPYFKRNKGQRGDDPMTTAL